MWILLKKHFCASLVTVMGYDERTARLTAEKAKPVYKSIIDKLPEFEKGDRFVTNIVNCAMLISFVKSMTDRPDVEKLTAFYDKAMRNGAVKAFCRMGGKSKFTDKGIASVKAGAALKAADRNPYSWNMEYIPYDDGSGYEARFTRCGICTLMKEYGCFDLVPAMCHLDYTMTELGGACRFVREHTLADGSPYCDNGYKRL